ncbi:MAG: nucleoside deaminase [Candidatus Omnitrophica bacterium]|nr:nucleoside deaminase [Candidatus Omnitrophota bacterium]
MPVIDRIYMSEALKEAKKALEAGEIPVGAVIMHRGQLIGRAHHQTHALKDPTAHAAMIAVTQAANALGNRWLKSAILYSTVKPCAMCAGAVALAGIARVVYGAVPLALKTPKVKTSSGVLGQESATLLCAYKKYRRNRKRLLL